MRRILHLAAIAAFLFALAGPARAGEKAEEEGEKKPVAQKEDKKQTSDPIAVERFDRAVAWQGEPETYDGVFFDFRVDRIEFKLWGENEVEGTFKLRHSAPDKIWFEVATQAWWRQYWSDGEAFYKRTGATEERGEYLNPEIDDDAETIDMIREAVRIVRLVYLKNHKTPGIVFKDMEKAKPKGKEDAPVCDLVKRTPVDKDPKELMYFYLHPDTGQPVCIGVWHFLNVRGIFFIHLSKFVPVQGVQLPTHIEVFAETKTEDFEKFLFADLVRRPEDGVRVKVNSGIDEEIYEFR